MPRPRLERLGIKEVARDGDTISCVGTEDGQCKDGAIKDKGPRHELPSDRSRQ